MKNGILTRFLGQADLKPGSPCPGSFQAAEHCDMKSAVMEDDSDTNMDSAPGPSGHGRHL